MAEETVYRRSVTAPVNIAVIKYWGKRDSSLNLPTNSSLSVTLSQADLATHTTASTSTVYGSEPDSLLINDIPQSLDTPRTKACLQELRSQRLALEATSATLPRLAALPLRIVSRNNFPTAAGLASSAAGFAALVRAIADLYGLPTSTEALSGIARLGSGSACRSLLGGYVAWNVGEAGDGRDSIAQQVAPAEHWPDMRAVILVVSAARKSVPSTAGMQATVATSTLFRERVATTVPLRMEQMRSAILAKDFGSFAKLTMADSNSFHATCLDTIPPIFYLNDVSRAAIAAVETINKAAGKEIAAYTFDAGPNAVIYYQAVDEESVGGVFKNILGQVEGWNGQRGSGIQINEKPVIDEAVAQVLKEGVSKVILTEVGQGPQITEDHLIDEHGKPIKK